MISSTDRFWGKVKKTPTCWIWTAYKNSKGYGRLSFKGKVVYAPRAAWILSKGPIPKDLVICHTCDNPSCVNPLHLFLGTILDNNRDRHKKNRDGDHSGEHNGRAVLTAKEVLQIKREYARGKITQKDLAKKYKVKQPRISSIVLGNSWRKI